MEYKIKAIAEDVVRKSHNDLDSKMAQRTKHFRDYIDTQLHNNVAAIQSL